MNVDPERSCTEMEIATNAPIPIERHEVEHGSDDIAVSVDVRATDMLANVHACERLLRCDLHFINADVVEKIVHSMSGCFSAIEHPKRKLKIFMWPNETFSCKPFHESLSETDGNRIYHQQVSD